MALNKSKNMDIQNFLSNYALRILAFVVILILGINNNIQYHKIRKFKIEALENKPLKIGADYTMDMFWSDYRSLCDLLHMDYYSYAEYGDDRFSTFFLNAADCFIKEISKSNFDELYAILNQFNDLPQMCKDGLKNYRFFANTKKYVSEVTEKKFEKVENKKESLIYFVESIKKNFRGYDELYPSFYERIEKIKKNLT